MCRVRVFLITLAVVGPKAFEGAKPDRAFDLLVVAARGGEVLSRGKGKITYTATSLMTASDHFPDCVANRVGTAEQANTSYGELPSGPSTTFTQTFTIMTPLACPKGTSRIFPSEKCVGSEVKTAPQTPPIP